MEDEDAKQVELERQHVQKKDMGCSRKGGHVYKAAAGETGWSRKNMTGTNGRQRAFKAMLKDLVLVQ